MNCSSILRSLLTKAPVTALCASTARLNPTVRMDGAARAFDGLLVGDKHSPACDPRCNMAESAQKGEAAPSGRTADSDSHRYMLGHLCVLGFHTLSYSEWRDAQMILAIGILFYCAMLLALSIFYSRKELRDMRRDGSR